MKIENVKYVPCSQDELWEKVDEIARYLRLTAEFGCADSGKKIFNEFENELTKLISQFQKLVLQQKDPDEPDDIEEIRKLRPDGPQIIFRKIIKQGCEVHFMAEWQVVH